MDNKNNSMPGWDDFFSGNKKDDNGGGNRPRSFLFYVFVAMIITLLLNTFVFPAMKQARIEPAAYSEFQKAITDKTVSKVEFNQNTIVYDVKKDGKTQTYSTTRVNNEFNEAQIMQELNAQGVEYNETIPVESNFFLNFILSWVVPLLLFMALGNWLSKRMGSAIGGMGGGFGLGGLGRSNAREYEKKDDSIRFKDVAGEDEAKELLTEMVDYLNHPDKYSRIGAKIPKGALLVGPPGTGKTMLAKAVAGEAGVPFFSISGSEFVEMYVGMGAAKVRDLFDQAKKKSPCIIFIDEIDAIGKKRGAGGLGGNDEREQTLNQLLTEMDGFDSNKAIILLAADRKSVA